MIEGFNSKIIKEKLCSPHPPEHSGKKKKKHSSGISTVLEVLTVNSYNL